MTKHVAPGLGKRQRLAVAVEPPQHGAVAARALEHVELAAGPNGEFGCANAGRRHLAGLAADANPVVTFRVLARPEQCPGVDLIGPSVHGDEAAGTKRGIAGGQCRHRPRKRVLLFDNAEQRRRLEAAPDPQHGRLGRAIDGEYLLPVPELDDGERLARSSPRPVRRHSGGELLNADATDGEPPLADAHHIDGVRLLMQRQLPGLLDGCLAEVVAIPLEDDDPVVAPVGNVQVAMGIDGQTARIVEMVPVVARFVQLAQVDLGRALLVEPDLVDDVERLGGLPVGLVHKPRDEHRTLAGHRRQTHKARLAAPPQQRAEVVLRNAAVGVHDQQPALAHLRGVIAVPRVGHHQLIADQRHRLVRQVVAAVVPEPLGVEREEDRIADDGMPLLLGDLNEAERLHLLVRQVCRPRHNGPDVLAPPGEHIDAARPLEPAVQHIEIPARIDGQAGDAAGDGLALPPEDAVELRPQPQPDAHRAVRGRDRLSSVIPAVPDQGLLQRVLLERLRRVLAEHPARQVTNDLAVGVLDGHRRVAVALRSQGDGHLAAPPRDLRLLSKLKDRLPLDLELVNVQGKGGGHCKQQVGDAYGLLHDRSFSRCSHFADLGPVMASNRTFAISFWPFLFGWASSLM